MKNIKVLISVIILVLFFQGNIYSQFSFQLSSQQEYNSNPFKSMIPESSFISGYDLTMQYELKNLGIMYSGSIVNFSNSRDRNYFLNMAGIWANFDSSAISFSVEQRINNPIYSYFDYHELSLNYEHQLSFWGVDANIYPSVAYTSYKNISILNNIKTTLSFLLNKSFETGTTFILGGVVNHKIYTQPNKTDLVQMVDESNNIVETFIESQNATSLTQLTALGRVAQSITPTTGLALQYTAKKIVSGLASSVKELNLTYGDESEIFDDPVNYDANSILIELTQILFDDLQIKLGYFNNIKSYPSQGTYNSNLDYSLDMTRKDTQNIFSFSIEKPVSFSNGLGLEIGLKYSYIKNNSNSFSYRYSGSSFNINIGLAF